MNREIRQFDQFDFVNNYWQKEPCIIRQFYPNFIDPLDPDELAGLACESDIDSRIVSFNNEQWDVIQGPFEDFASVCKGRWTLLVQGVDKYVEEVNKLTEQIGFIPFWRFDDVMVSYSVKDSGVGAHTDEYDVFIIQGKGSRKWRVGKPNDSKTFFPHPSLKQIDRFTPIIDEILSPGDCIYIPPKHPHQGIALSECMNYSIGFRAPTDIELLSGILDEVDFSDQQVRYTDEKLAEYRTSSDLQNCVTDLEINALNSCIRDFLKTNTATNAMLSYLSRQELPNNKPIKPLAIADVIHRLKSEELLHKGSGVKPIYSNPNCQKETFEFFIDGTKFCIHSNRAEQDYIVKHLFNSDFFALESFSNSFEQDRLFRLLTDLVNAGYWYFEDI